MTLPLTSPFTDNTLVNKAAMDQLVASINALGFGYMGSTASVTTTTITTGATYTACSAVFTFTLTTQRRVRVAVSSDVQVTTAPARYLIRPAYNTGSSVTTPIPFGQPISLGLTATGVNGICGDTNEWTVVLAAGTYTAYCVVYRLSGGSATDLSVSNWVQVYDVGPS